MNSVRKFAIFSGCFALMPFTSAVAGGPTTTLQTEYLMTFAFPLSSIPVDKSLTIVNVTGSGTVAGKVNGNVVGAGADWLRAMPSGVLRMDVRGAIQTDDKQVIYVSYNGVVACDKPTMERAAKGELIKSDECYFMAAPTFETSSEKYSWLNRIQTVAKMVEIKLGEGSHITYDVFAVK